MIHNVEEKAPLRRTVTQTEVGNTAAFLLSDLSLAAFQAKQFMLMRVTALMECKLSFLHKNVIS